MFTGKFENLSAVGAGLWSRFVAGQGLSGCLVKCGALRFGQQSLLVGLACCLLFGVFGIVGSGPAFGMKPVEQSGKKVSKAVKRFLEAGDRDQHFRDELGKAKFGNADRAKVLEALPGPEGARLVSLITNQKELKKLWKQLSLVDSDLQDNVWPHLNENAKLLMVGDGKENQGFLSEKKQQRLVEVQDRFNLQERVRVMQQTPPVLPGATNGRIVFDDNLARFLDRGDMCRLVLVCDHNSPQGRVYLSERVENLHRGGTNHPLRQLAPTPNANIHWVKWVKASEQERPTLFAELSDGSAFEIWNSASTHNKDLLYSQLSVEQRERVLNFEGGVYEQVMNYRFGRDRRTIALNVESFTAILPTIWGDLNNSERHRLLESHPILGVKDFFTNLFNNKYDTQPGQHNLEQIDSPSTIDLATNIWPKLEIKGRTSWLQNVEPNGDPITYGFFHDLTTNQIGGENPAQTKHTALGVHKPSEIVEQIWDLLIEQDKQKLTEQQKQRIILKQQRLERERIERELVEQRTQQRIERLEQQREEKRQEVEQLTQRLEQEQRQVEQSKLLLEREKQQRLQQEQQLQQKQRQVEERELEVGKLKQLLEQERRMVQRLTQRLEPLERDEREKQQRLEQQRIQQQQERQQRIERERVEEEKKPTLRLLKALNLPELQPSHITTIAGNGSAGFGGDNGLATSAQLYSPFGVFVSLDGDVFIADRNNHRVRRVSPGGVISTVAGDGTEGFGGDNGLATSAQLNSPLGVFVSLDGDVFIADRNNHRVRRVSPGGVISTVAGSGTKGFGGDNGPATGAQLNSPVGVFVSLDGDVFIADRNNHRVRRVSPQGVISTVAGSGTYGFGGDNGLATSAQLYHPEGVFVSLDGHVFIVDTYNHRVRRVSPEGVISTVAGSGTAGFGGDNGPATSAQLNWPSGVFVTLDGHIYIADWGNGRVRRVSPQGVISTVAGSGTYGFGGDNGLATSAQLYHPVGVFVSLDGHIYIADNWNHRIRVINLNQNK